MRKSLALAPALALGTCLLSIVAFAADHGAAAHGEEHGIPTAVILQAVNFAIYAALVIFFIRKPIRSYFESREAGFRQALVKAQEARREAEQKKTEIQNQLNELQSTQAESVEQARAEAETLKARIIQDAKDMAQRLREEAQRTTDFEVQRAKNELREDLLKQSVALASKILTEKMAEPDQKRLQTEFVDKIQETR